ncbi:MAG: helix-turn-helix domain-containing protein [Ferribacterium limneticum]
MNFDTLPDTAHITIKVVCTILGVSPSTVWRMVRAGKLAEPVKLSVRCTRWKAGQVREAAGIKPANDGQKEAA